MNNVVSEHAEHVKPEPVGTANDVKVGDILLRRKLLVMHVGICIGANKILHSLPGNGEHITDYDSFAKDKNVYRLPTRLDASTVQEKAEAILQSPADYGLFGANCEHTVSKLVNGTPRSRQLEEVEAWALIGAAFGKSIGRKSMYLGGLIGALGGLISLPGMWWIRRE